MTVTFRASRLPRPDRTPGLSVSGLWVDAAPGPREQPLVLLPQPLTEVTGPRARRGSGRAPATTTSPCHGAEPLGQRIVVAGRVLDSDGRPVPIAGGGLAGQRRRPLPARRRQLAGAARPALHRRGTDVTDDQGRYRFTTDQAGRLPVGQPPQRLAPGPHPLLALRPGLHPAARHPDVLPGRPAVLPGPDLQLRPRRRRGRGWSPLRPRPRPHPSGRWPSPSTSCCAAASRPRSRNRMSDRARRPGAGRAQSCRSRRRRPSARSCTSPCPGTTARTSCPTARRARSGSAGRSVDGAGDPVPDALVETWQADPEGRFDHPDDPGPGRPADRGARPPGVPRLRPVPDRPGRRLPRSGPSSPGPLPAPGGGQPQAPHLDLSVFARGLLDRLVTRIYFPDEPRERGRPRPGVGAGGAAGDAAGPSAGPGRFHLRHRAAG